MKTQLSTLENVDIRNIWENETNDFTPWLAQSDNIDHIGEAIGIDLTVEEKEKHNQKATEDAADMMQMMVM